MKKDLGGADVDPIPFFTNQALFDFCSCSVLFVGTTAVTEVAYNIAYVVLVISSTMA